MAERGSMKVGDEYKRGYSREVVDSIVQRMKKLYMEKGYSETEASAEALRTVVSGSRTREIETRTISDLKKEKNIIFRLAGYLFSTRLLESLVDRLASMDFSLKLMHDLDSANIRLSTKQYLAISLFVSLLVSLFISIFVFVLSLSSVVLALVYSVVAFIVSFIISFFVSITWPESTARARGVSIDRALPFALRHMATEIKAGMGIHRTIESIAESNYGPLSEEFSRVLEDIDKGATTEEAILALSDRSPSDELSRAALHINRAIRVGGNLADILSRIADDVSFSMRVKMRDYVERLSLISLFYMMVGVVLPVFFSVIAAIFNSVPNLGFQGLITPGIMLVVYVVLIPMMLGLILYIIKVTQPM